MFVLRRVFMAAFAAAVPVASVLAQEQRLPDLVVTAGRTPQLVQQTGSAISVVRSEDLATTNPTSVIDALRAVPGLDATESGGPGGTVNVRLRGGNNGQTLVLIDGVRVNDPAAAGGDFEFAMVDPGAIDRIEVLRGPQSALYGSDAIGGVINIITKSGQGKPKVNIRGEGGRYGAAAGSGSLTGSEGPWSYAFSGTGQRADGFSRYGYRLPAIEARFPSLERDPFQRFGGLARIGYDPGNGFKIEAAGMKSYTHSDYDAQTGRMPDSPSVATRIFEQYWVRTTLETGAITHTTRVSTSRTERDNYDVSQPSTQVTKTQTNAVGTRSGAEYQGEAKLGAFGTLIAGSKFDRDDMSIYTAQYLPTAIPGKQLLGTGQETRSVFALWQVPVGERLHTSVGGRIDSVPNVDQFDTWRATVAYLIPESSSKLRASAGTGGKAPTLYQLNHPTFGNPNLKSEHSIGWDAGIDQSFFNKRVNASVTAFSNNFTNLIDFDVIQNRYFNTSKAVTTGMEVAADAELSPALLRLKGAYTYMRARDGLTGLQLARRPQNSGRIALAITPSPDLLIEPRVFFVSSRFSSAGQVNPVSAYGRLDIYSEYKVDQYWRLFVRLENALNAHYQEATNFGTTGPALYAGANVTW